MQDVLDWNESIESNECNIKPKSLKNMYKRSLAGNAQNNDGSYIQNWLESNESNECFMKQKSLKNIYKRWVWQCVPKKRLKGRCSLL